MAEALLRHITTGRHEVRSAGIAAQTGTPATEAALRALDELGIPHEGESTRVDRMQLEWADLVLCMQEHHRDVILLDHPDLAGKIRTLAEWAGEPESDIPDPFGGDTEEYRRTRDEIERLIRKGLDRS